MKKFILIVTAVVFMSCTNIYADEYIKINDFDFRDTQTVIEEQDFDVDVEHVIEQISRGKITEALNEVIDEAKDHISTEFSNVKSILIGIIFSTILSAIFSNFSMAFSNQSISEMGFYVCYVLQVSILISVFNIACKIGENIVNFVIEFMSALLPAYMLSVGILGQVSASGFYQTILIGLTVMQVTVLKIVLPMLKIYMVINLVNNISREDLLSKTSELVKNFIRFINRAMIGAITGINLLQGMILPSVDGTKNNVIRKAVSVIPVIGDGTGTMAEIVMNSAGLIKNSIGIFAMIILVVVCAVPIIKIQCYSVMLQISNALLQPIADKRIIKGISATVESIRMLDRCLITTALMFIIAIAIVCLSTNVIV